MSEDNLKAPRIAVSAARPPFFAGVDLGGTNIKLGILDCDGHTVAARSFSTLGELGPESAMQRSAQQLQAACHDIQLNLNQIIGVGLATPGTMDIPAGLILAPPNLPENWRHFPIRESLAAATGKKVIYANDANAAAFGEYWIGSGKAFASIVFLTLGTGMGAGIIIDGGFPLDGNHSHGGECGHIIIDSAPDARQCGCGQRGHMEAYCSATALVKQAEIQLAAGKQSALSSLANNNEEITALAIAEAADRGDSLALELIFELATHLGRGMVTIAHTVDPAAMILGGAMNFGGPNSELGNQFLAHVSDTFRQLAFPVLAEKIKIRFSELGSDAGYVGAAGMARRDYFRANGEG